MNFQEKIQALAAIFHKAPDTASSPLGETIKFADLRQGNVPAEHEERITTFLDWKKQYPPKGHDAELYAHGWYERFGIALYGHTDMGLWLIDRNPFEGRENGCLILKNGLSDMEPWTTKDTVEEAMRYIAEQVEQGNVEHERRPKTSGEDY